MSCCYYTIYIYHILKYKYHRLKENIRNKCCCPKPDPIYQLEEVVIINNDDSLDRIQPNKNYAFKYINDSSSEEVIYDRDEETNTSSSVISNSERTHLFTNEIKLRRRNALKRKISKGKLIKKKRNKKYKKFENNIEDLINPKVESPTTQELNWESVEYETIPDIQDSNENKIKKYTKKKEKKIEVISSEEEGEPIYEEIKEDFIPEEKLIKEDEIIPKEKIRESAEIIIKQDDVLKPEAVIDKEAIINPEVILEEDITDDTGLSSGLEDWDIIKN